ncbi:MAG: hypothetical protein ACYDAI_11040 [Trichloromonadaceae bacterium]
MTETKIIHVPASKQAVIKVGRFEELVSPVGPLDRLDTVRSKLSFLGHMADYAHHVPGQLEGLAFAILEACEQIEEISWELQHNRRLTGFVAEEGDELSIVTE